MTNVRRRDAASKATPKITPITYLLFHHYSDSYHLLGITLRAWRGRFISDSSNWAHPCDELCMSYSSCDSSCMTFVHTSIRQFDRFNSLSAGTLYCAQTLLYRGGQREWSYELAQERSPAPRDAPTLAWEFFCKSRRDVLHPNRWIWFHKYYGNYSRSDD